MIRAVIFDLDGVLTKSDHYHTAAWRETCLRRGMPFDGAVADLLRGVSRMESARIIAARGNVELTERALSDFAEEKNGRYVRLLEQMTQADVFPGVPELLEFLRRRNVPAAVASSSKNAMLILEKTGLKNYFSAVIDGHQITRSKPDPQVFQKAADALGVPYEDCLVAEDAVSGVEAALALGCKVAAVGAAASAPGVTYPLTAIAELQSVLSGTLLPHLHVSPRPAALRENMVTDGGYRVTVLTDRLFRVERGSFTDEATQAVWYRDFPPVDFTWTAEGNELRIKTGALTLAVNKTSFPDSEVIFADGSRAKLDNSENLLGTCSTLDTNGYHLREHPEVDRYDRDHIPLDMGVCSRRGAAVYDDSGSLLLHSDGTLTPRSGAMDAYVFAYGHDYPEAVRALYRLCGVTPVLPRWALGNWWCRYWPYTQQEYTNLMDNFADDGIPISVAVIDMDWHHVNIEGDFGAREKGLDGEDYGGTDGWTGYTWNEELFPDHRELLKELRRRGLHTALNLHPALGVRWYEKPYRQMAESMDMDPAEKKVVPFRIADPRFVNSYLNVLHHPLEDEGVDFWWIDWQQGKASELEGLDPLWALNHYHYLDSAYRRKSGLILSRYAGVGSHRYPVGFSGDIHMDWTFLDYMPYFTATAANVGYGWWSHDIGGHHRGERDEELYLRWLQFGVFSPINRIHCCPAEVTSKEPWTLSAGPRAVAEKWFRFRHRLVPYLYSASWKNHLEGVPLIRPMYYEWPEEEAAYEADHQYLFGDLIVAPITEKSAEQGIAEKRVWLPEGIWTDVFTGLRYTGGRWLTVCRDMGCIPVFARAGAILPLAAKAETGCGAPDSLELFVYAGDGAYSLYEGPEPARTEFQTHMCGSETQLLTIRNGDRARTYHVYFKNVEDGACDLLIDGKIRPVTTRRNRCLQAVLELQAGETAELIAAWQERDAAAALRAEILKSFIQIPQDNWYKEKQWEAAGRIEGTEAWEKWIRSLDIPEVGRHMLEEKLWAMRPE